MEIQKQQLESTDLTSFLCRTRPRLGTFLLPLAISTFVFPAAAWSQNQTDETFAIALEGYAKDPRIEKIDAMLSKQFKLGEPGASIVIVQFGTIVFLKAYGLANMQTGASMQVNMPLRAGSITKQMTAAAIMLLVEQGKLSLSDPLGKYFPEYPEPGRHATLEQLLTHTSGIRNYTALPQFGTVVGKDVSIDEAIAFFKDAKPEFQPGQRFSYSNSNYFLLGAIIEKASGLAYPAFMQQQIFEPLKMHDSLIEEPNSPANAVAGYTQNRKSISKVADYSMSWPFAAGALRTSVEDLYRWNLAVTQGALLKQASWNRMATEATLNNGKRSPYGYGWFIGKYAGDMTLEHGGDIGGFSADTWYSPKQGTFIAVMSNNDNHDPAPDSVREKIADILLKR